MWGPCEISANWFREALLVKQNISEMVTIGVLLVDLMAPSELPFASSKFQRHHHHHHHSHCQCLKLKWSKLTAEVEIVIRVVCNQLLDRIKFWLFCLRLCRRKVIYLFLCCVNTWTIECFPNLCVFRTISLVGGQSTYTHVHDAYRTALRATLQNKLA